MGKKLRGPAVSHSMRRNLVTQELLLLFTCDLDALWKLVFMGAEVEHSKKQFGNYRVITLSPDICTYHIKINIK